MCLCLWGQTGYPAISRTSWGNFFKFCTDVQLDSRMNWLDLGDQRSQVQVTVTSHNMYPASWTRYLKSAFIFTCWPVVTWILGLDFSGKYFKYIYNYYYTSYLGYFIYLTFYGPQAVWFVWCMFLNSCHHKQSSLENDSKSTYLHVTQHFQMTSQQTSFDLKTTFVLTLIRRLQNTSFVFRCTFLLNSLF